MKVEVYDADDTAHDVKTLDLTRQDFLGRREFSLADAARDLSKPLVLNLKGTGSDSTCTVHMSEVVDFKKALCVTFRAERLTNKDRCEHLSWTCCST